MKFYFCEACGKRITENDIQSGSGHDKKLRGVFCKDCSIGVMTLETMPLTEDQARNILKNSSPAPEQNAPGTTRKKTSSMQIPAATRAKGLVHHRPVGNSSTARKPVLELQPTALKGVLAAGFIMMISVICFFLFLGNSEVSTAHVNDRSKENGTIIIASPALGRSSTPQKKTISVDQAHTKDDAISPANGSFPAQSAIPTSETALMVPFQKPLRLDPSPLQFKLLCETNFEGQVLDSFWEIKGNAPNRLTDGAWRVDTSTSQERGAALVSAKAYPLDRRYRLTVLGGMRGGTPGWKDYGQNWIVGVYSNSVSKLEPDACPVVPSVLATISNSKISVGRFNTEKLWSSALLAENSALPEKKDYEAVFEVDADSVALTVDGKEYYRGSHGANLLKQVHFILRGCVWKDPKGAEVWFRTVKIEECTPQAVSSKTDPSSTTQQMTASRVRESSSVFNAHLDRILQSVREQNLEKANQFATQMTDDPLLVELRSSIKIIPDILVEIKKQILARDEAINKLTGQSLSIETLRGTVKGKVTSVGGKILKIQPQYAINEEIRAGPTIAVSLSEITPDGIVRLLGEPDPETPQSWLARSLIWMVEDRTALAEAALAHSLGHPLASLLRGRLEQLSSLQRETAATAEWEKLETESKGKITRDQAKRLLLAMAAFETTCAKTEFVRTHTDNIRFSRLKLEGVASELDQRIAMLISGKISAFDPNSKTLTVQYDLSDKKQIDDFAVGSKDPNGGKVDFSTGVLNFKCGVMHIPLLYTSRFINQMLTIRMTYRNANGFIAFHLGQASDDGELTSLMFLTDQNSFQVVSLNDKNRRWKMLKNTPIQRPQQGSMILQIQKDQVTLLIDGKLCGEYSLPNTVLNGWGIGGGVQSTFVIERLDVTGVLDPQWLTKAVSP